MVTELSDWFVKNPEKSFPIASAVIGLFVGGVWTALVFFQKILSEREQKKFDRYRLLVTEINEGRGSDGKVYIAYQLDGVYELRFHRKYYPRSILLLSRLKKDWERSENYDAAHLLEIDQTIDYMRHRANSLSRLSMYLYTSMRLFWKRDRLMDSYSSKGDRKEEV